MKLQNSFQLATLSPSIDARSHFLYLLRDDRLNMKKKR